MKKLKDLVEAIKPTQKTWIWAINLFVIIIVLIWQGTRIYYDARETFREELKNVKRQNQQIQKLLIHLQSEVEVLPVYFEHEFGKASDSTNSKINRVYLDMNWKLTMIIKHGKEREDVLLDMLQLSKSENFENEVKRTTPDPRIGVRRKENTNGK